MSDSLDDDEREGIVLYTRDDLKLSAVLGVVIGVIANLNGQRAGDPEATVVAVAAGLLTAALVLMTRIPAAFRRRDEADERDRLVRHLPAPEVAARDDLARALQNAGIDGHVELTVRRPRRRVTPPDER